MAISNRFDLQFFMQSQDVGHYGIAKTICSLLDFNDLKSIRATSKICYDFLMEEKQIWISKMEHLYQKYLHVLLDDTTGPSMAKSKIKIDYENWMLLLHISQTNGSVKNFIQISNLVKQTENMIWLQDSFCPLETLLATFNFRYFEDFEEFCLKYFVGNDFKSLVAQHFWYPIIDICLKSMNSEVISFFVERLFEIDSRRLEDFIKSLDLEEKNKFCFIINELPESFFDKLLMN